MRGWPHEHNGVVGGKEELLREVVDGDSSMDEERPDPNVILPSLGFERPGSTERIRGGTAPREHSLVHLDYHPLKVNPRPILGVGDVKEILELAW